MQTFFHPEKQEINKKFCLIFFLSRTLLVYWRLQRTRKLMLSAETLTRLPPHLLSSIPKTVATIIESYGALT